jgi:hypothetical protein
MRRCKNWCRKRQGIEKKHKWERMPERHHHRGAEIRNDIYGDVIGEKPA